MKKYVKQILYNLHIMRTHMTEYAGKRWVLSADLKEEADLENLISFRSVFQSVGTIIIGESLFAA